MAPELRRPACAAEPAPGHGAAPDRRGAGDGATGTIRVAGHLCAETAATCWACWRASAPRKSPGLLVELGRISPPGPGRCVLPEEVEVVTGSAAWTDVYAGIVPVDVVIVCGVFGNVPEGDVARTVAGAAGVRPARYPGRLDPAPAARTSCPRWSAGSPGPAATLSSSTARPRRIRRRGQRAAGAGAPAPGRCAALRLPLTKEDSLRGESHRRGRRRRPLGCRADDDSRGRVRRPAGGWAARCAGPSRPTPTSSWWGPSTPTTRASTCATPPASTPDLHIDPDPAPCSTRALRWWSTSPCSARSAGQPGVGAEQRGPRGGRHHRLHRRGPRPVRAVPASNCVIAPTSPSARC